MPHLNRYTEEILPFTLNVLLLLVKEADIYLVELGLKIAANARIRQKKQPIKLAAHVQDFSAEALLLLLDQDSSKLITAVKAALEESISELSIYGGYTVQKVLENIQAVELATGHMLNWPPGSLSIKKGTDSGKYYYPDIFRLFSSYTIYELCHNIASNKIGDDAKISYYEGEQWARALLNFSHSENFSLFRLGNLALYVGSKSH